MARRGRPRKDGGGEETDQNIIVQLRKCINLHGMFTVVFRNGDRKNIHPSIASQVCERYMDMDAKQKFDFQDRISANLASFESSLKP